MHGRLLALVLLALVACKSDKPSPSTAKAGSGAAATAKGTVELFIDNAPVGTVTPAQVAQWPRLDTLLPVEARRLGMWRTLDILGPLGPMNITQPSAQHPDLVPALYPGPHGIAFGYFDPVELAKKGKPELEQTSVTQIRIALDKTGGRGQNEHGAGGGANPAELSLSIKTKAGVQTLSGEKILALPREPAPGEADPHAGWRLLAVLESAGVKGPKRLLLTDASGTNVTLEAQDLDPATSVPFLKLNRQGALRFRVFYKEGTTWQMRSDLRGLTSVEVLQ